MSEGEVKAELVVTGGELVDGEVVAGTAAVLSKFSGTVMHTIELAGEFTITVSSGVAFTFWII